MDPFVHLHVASGYSLRYGAAHPRGLVERAAELEMDTLALTDRDGLYGAVRFARACLTAGVRPVLGVDLAIEPTLVPAAGAPGRGSRARSEAGGLLGTGGAPGRVAGRPDASGQPGAGSLRTPARGGAYLARDRALPRVTLLAGSKAGWAALCRLVSDTHLRGERGAPVTTRELVADRLAGLRSGHDVVVMLGPWSELGQAVTLRRDDLAAEVLRAWRAAVDPADLVVEVVTHRVAGRGPGSGSHAARLAGFATAAGCGLVLTNAVRYVDRADAPVVDVLDAARRLVPLDPRHLDRANAEGFLKSGKEMADVADEVCRLAGLGPRAADRLLAHTRAVADRCAVDPRSDLGIGEVHFPELQHIGGGPGGLRAPAGAPAGAVLRSRCDAGIGRRYGPDRHAAVRARLDDELAVVDRLGYATYFLTVADIVDAVHDLGVRVAARGSGAGSLVNYLLGISGVDPLRYGLLMERFLSPLRQALPDIDIDVESARRLEVYEHILQRYGGERCTCVSMMDTYRVRHAVRDVGAALGMPLGEIDSIAKAFPHIAARDVRAALQELPELRASGLGEGHLDLLFALVEKLDGLPRHVAVHPCGVLLSDATLLDRTPVEASYLGYPMSQFDKDDVEDLGLLKLDVLGVRMQSAMAHAVDEVARVDGASVDIDDEAQAPRDDPATYALIQSTRTLGCFQIESPGQRELVGKFGPETFDDIIIDISLFRPGPVKSDMVVPFLRARQGWSTPDYLHPDLEPVLAQTGGVVVFHEQVIEVIALLTGCTLAEADEARRALGDREGKADLRLWFFPRAMGRGYPSYVVRRVWEVLEAFASFGFCKAHAAAFALPTFQSAWLKAHHPAAFFAGVLTHDPGMYPKRLILADARQFGVAVLPLDVNRSDVAYRVERLPADDPPLGRSIVAERTPTAAACAGGLPGRGADEMPGRGGADIWHIGDDDPLLGQPSVAERGPTAAARAGGLPGRGVDEMPGRGGADIWHIGDDENAAARLPTPRYGVRVALTEVKGISDAEVARIVAARPFHSLTDLWQRARVSRPTAERLVLAGGLDAMYGIGAPASAYRRRSVTRRDLLLSVAELDRWTRATDRAVRAASPRPGRSPAGPASGAVAGADPRLLAAGQAQGPRPAEPPSAVQLTLDLGDVPAPVAGSGLPELSVGERVRAELEILGLDVSRHVVDFYAPMLDELCVTRSTDLLHRRSRSELWVAGVKVATQTPPIRSGRRVIFLTLDDGTGPVDATFFEDVQGPYAATVFHSWLLLVRGELRRTGPRGVSLRATGCWELAAVYAAWQRGGVAAVGELVTACPPGFGSEQAGQGAAASRSTRPVMAGPPRGSDSSRDSGPGDGRSTAGGMGRRRVLVHPSGFRQSPYADVRPAGDDVKSAPRKLWHSSPGSAG